MSWSKKLYGFIVPQNIYRQDSELLRFLLFSKLNLLFYGLGLCIFQIKKYVIAFEGV